MKTDADKGTDTDEACAILGACVAVDKAKGCGFVEPVGQERLEVEGEHWKIPAVLQPSLSLIYGGRTLKQRSQPDFISLGKIMLEIKALWKLVDKHRAEGWNLPERRRVQAALAGQLRACPGLEYERVGNTENQWTNTPERINEAEPFPRVLRV